MSEVTDTELSKEVIERIERNKQNAIKLQRSRLVAQTICEGGPSDKKTIKIGRSTYKDTGGGFLLEELPEDENFQIAPEREPPIFEPDRPTCDECKETFASSWLFDTFDLKVCDGCKDPEVHKLVTKTDVMNEYLLRESDFNRHGPPLKFITRKNPHNVRWGEMKLYLQIQVEERALLVWGSKEKLQEELDHREEKRIMTKTKKYRKQMKELRMNMRSSLYDRTTAASHVHSFGPETYNEEEDTYTHNCLTCDYQETFEKM